MILGTLNDHREAVVRLVVRGRFGGELETDPPAVEKALAGIPSEVAS